MGLGRQLNKGDTIRNLLRVCLVVILTLLLAQLRPPLPHAKAQTLTDHVNNTATVASEQKQTSKAQVNETKQDIQAPVVEPPKPVAQTVSAPTDNRSIGKQMAEAYGWTGDQWFCLERLWTGESNWNHTAINASSGAGGIPQSLPMSKMASFGADYATNPRTQIAWGLSYIKGRYETPCSAWYAWNSRSPHWY